MGATEWPPQTKLVDHTARQDGIAKGEAFDIHATLEGIIPEKATVAFHFGEGSTVRSRAISDCSRKDESRSGTLAARLPTGRVAGSVRYQIRANDAVTPWREVKVLPPSAARWCRLRRPGIAADSHWASPDYAEFPPRHLPDGTANIEGGRGHATCALRRRGPAAVGRLGGVSARASLGFNLAAFLGPLAATGLTEAGGV